MRLRRRKASMAAEVLPIFLLFGLLLTPCAQSRTEEFHLINLRKNWSEAQQFCRDRYSDLATVGRAEDMSRVPARPHSAWVGLFDDPASWRGRMTSDPNSWRWSATGSTSPGGFHSWALGEPDYDRGRELCVFIRDGFWRDFTCGTQLHFACYKVQSQLKVYTVVRSGSTWAGAQSFCRQHFHDLAMIESSAENQALMVQVDSGTSTVWIGLYRQPWAWSDHSPSTFRNWNSGEPSNKDQREHCAELPSDMNDISCDRQLPFICQGALKLRTVTAVSMKLQSSVDLSASAIMEQLSLLLTTKLEVEGRGLKLKWSRPPTKQRLKPVIKSC